MRGMRLILNLGAWDIDLDLIPKGSTFPVTLKACKAILPAL